MAAGVLQKPGTKLGPCKSKACGHRDCAATRADAASLCRFCNEPITYGRAFVRARFDGSLAHDVCLEQAAGRNDARVGLF